MPDAPVLLAPGEGEGTDRFTILADRPEVALTEFRYEPLRDGAARHIHRHHADAFYVLEGDLRITLDEDELVLGPGGFALIPPGVIHGFGNPSDRPGRYLNFHAPGCGFGDYLRGNNPDFDQDYDVPLGSGRPTEEAKVVEPGGGDLLEIGARRSTVMGGVEDGIGSLAVLESVLPPNLVSPALHVHEQTVDSFYVMEGTLTLHLGDDTVDAHAGTYALVPPGNAHTFANPRDEPVRVLNLMAPAGFERYFREVAATGGPFDVETTTKIASKYDFRAI